MTLVLGVGPRLILPRWALSVLATGYRRWFGGQALSQGHGARMQATHYVSARTALSMGASVQKIRHYRTPLQSGPAYSMSAGIFHALTPASSITARLGLA